MKVRNLSLRWQISCKIHMADAAQLSRLNQDHITSLDLNRNMETSVGASHIDKQQPGT
jgi:hypothetical protein